MDYTSPEDVSDMVDEATGTIGHAILLIDTGNPRTTYAYTAGLSAVGWHDLVIMGLGYEVARTIVDALVTHLRRTETRPAAGSSFLIGDPKIRLELVAVPPAVASTHALHAFAYRDRHSPLARSPGILQVLWPDAQGRSPHDPSYDSAASPQSILSAAD